MSVVCIEKESTKDALRHGRIAHLYQFDRSQKDYTRDLRIINDFDPYIYVPDHVVVPQMEGIKRVERGFKSITGQPVKKIVFGPGADPFRIIGQFPETFEADYKFINRYHTDMGLGYFENPYITAFDIETDSSKFPQWENAKYPITAISVYDYKLNKILWFVWRPDFEHKIIRTRYKLKEGKIDVDVAYDKYFFTSEKNMLRWFLRYIKDNNPDILTGWNIKRFDLPYIIKRCERLGLNYNSLSPLKKAWVEGDRGAVIEGRVILDLLTFYKKLQLSELKSFKLDVVGEHVCGVGKVKHVVSIGELWRTNFKKFEEYSVKDSVLVWQINELETVLPFVFEMAAESSCLPQLVQFNKDIVDAYIMKWCHGRWVLPTRMRGVKKGYKGAIVLNPVPGLHRNVIGTDLKSLYPSIIIAFNMSPETLIHPDNPNFDSIPKVHAGGNTYFRTDKVGILPTLLLELFALREKYENLRDQYLPGTPEYEMYYRKQFAIKGIMNSFYGMLAFPDFRLYTLEIAAAITRIGRNILKWTEKEAEKLGFLVIYGDTDSIFIKLPDRASVKKLVQIGKQIAVTITESYTDFAAKYGAEGKEFKLVFEKLYRRILFVPGDKPGDAIKKRYAGLKIWVKGQVCKIVEIVGWDAIKSDSSQLSRDLQEKILTIIVTGRKVEDVRKIIRNIVIKLEANEYEWNEIAVPMQTKKALHLYTGNWANHAHIRGARYSNKWLGTQFGAGTKPKRVYVKTVPPGYDPTDVICVDEDTVVPPMFTVDTDRMIDTCVKAKLKRIMVVMGWRWDQIGESVIQKSITEFFPQRT